MSVLDGRVVVVTGAGRGLGREHARLLAAEGASVVINDLGCAPDGSGSDPAPATTVATELERSGARAVASVDDVATMAGATNVLDLALATYGRVDALVNSAGVLRDRMFVNMTEDEWDDVIRGQLRSTFCASQVFAGHWRTIAKTGAPTNASIVNVSSTSGLLGAVGQSNYGAAKAGIASLTMILAEELARYGVRVNAIVPVARTRMTQDVPQFAAMLAAPVDEAEFDVYHPGNVSPLVAWLATEHCAANGQIYYAKGGQIRQVLGWHYGATLEKSGRWTVDELAAKLPGLG